jgi:tetratricopeptide (TPR) repeat protein
MVAATLVVRTDLRAADAPAPDPMVAARQAIDSFDWESAYKQFSQIAAAAEPGSDRWVQATFGAAVASSQRVPEAPEHTQRANELYAQILQKAPNSPYVPRVLMNQGRIKELRDYKGDLIDLAGARELYLKVSQQWPDLPIAGEATLRAAATLIQTYDAKDRYAKVKQGIGLLEDWLAKHPKDALASAMWQYLGDSYFFPLNDPAKSLAAYDQADALGWVDKGNEGPLLWRCAVLAERTSNRDSAVRYYAKIVTDAPNSGKAYESQLALKRLGAPVPEINIFRKATSQPGEAK